MSKENCSICQLPRASVHCGVCESAICKNCESFLEPDHFSFLSTVPEELKLIHYCPDCFEQKVAPLQVKYDETMAAAREVNIFFIADRNLPRILKKATSQIIVQDCKDRDETILRLGFMAADLGFNSVIKVDVAAKQIRNLAYQTSSWRGTGIPADIDVEKYFR